MRWSLMRSFGQLTCLMLFFNLGYHTQTIADEASASVVSRFLGTWDCDIVVVAPDGTQFNGKATSARRLSKSGAYLYFDDRSETGGEETQLVVTYDAAAHRLVGTGLNGKKQLEVVGTWEAQTNTMSFKIKGSDGTSIQYEHHFVDANNAKISGFIVDGEGRKISYNTTQSRRKGESSHERQITAPQLISSMDEDNDGMISLAEASEDLRLYFDRFDSNRDGLINAKEATALLPYANQNQPNEQTAASNETDGITASQIIGYLDKNGDAKLSRDEASDELRPHFDEFDTNGDGLIDADEAAIIAKYANGQNQP